MLCWSAWINWLPMSRNRVLPFTNAGSSRLIWGIQVRSVERLPVLSGPFLMHSLTRFVRFWSTGPIGLFAFGISLAFYMTSQVRGVFRVLVVR